MNRPPLEVADVVRAGGDSFIERSRKWITWKHVKVLLAIARCRTAALGLCVFLPNQSLFPASQGHPSAAHLSFQQPFFSPSWMLCSAAHPRCIPKPTLPTIEFA